MNLNDLRMFGAVVAEGSFTAAAKRLGVPKSRVSRHVAELEAQLGLRLLQRSTRKLSVTTIGAELQRHATALLEEAAAAEAAMQRARSEPSGLLRVSCPVLLAQQTLAPLLAAHEVLLDLHSFHTAGEPFAMVGPRDNPGSREPFARAAEELALEAFKDGRLCAAQDAADMRRERLAELEREAA